MAGDKGRAKGQRRDSRRRLLQQDSAHLFGPFVSSHNEHRDGEDETILSQISVCYNKIYWGIVWVPCVIMRVWISSLEGSRYLNVNLLMTLSINREMQSEFGRSRVLSFLNATRGWEVESIVCWNVSAWVCLCASCECHHLLGVRKNLWCDVSCTYSCLHYDPKSVQVFLILMMPMALISKESSTSRKKEKWKSDEIRWRLRGMRGTNNNVNEWEESKPRVMFASQFCLIFLWTSQVSCSR